MRRNLNINSRRTGKCTWTLGEGTLLLDSIISNILFEEASGSGSSGDELLGLQPGILKAALASLSDVEWVSATGVRLVTSNISTLELERRATELTGSIEAAANATEGNTKMELLNTLSKAKEYLASVKESGTRSSDLASQLQARMVDYNAKRRQRRRCRPASRT
jgi:hypothetical protein